MIIECPHCSEDNKIEYAENIRCKKCEKDYKGFEFSKRKIITGTALALLTYVGFHTLNDEIKGYGERYPIAVEYALLDSCINGSTNSISKSNYLSKRDACLCALKDTQEDYPYADYKDNVKGFVPIFRQNAKSCR
ncbi:hypothetical protein TUM4261_33560 [Shewanella sp. c952]|uniref:hypothetical protein n=1 Tax=Shewanella sp. c952 TaxID=2815913 RepID=UPI001BC32070|nr:hypothetical protein [Shewanella sp. c952]GIU15873.1 hypothetical protein TUM4261_33560 [Shewanella sp. c952]